MRTAKEAVAKSLSMTRAHYDALVTKVENLDDSVEAMKEKRIKLIQEMQELAPIINNEGMIIESVGQLMLPLKFKDKSAPDPMDMAGDVMEAETIKAKKKTAKAS